MTKYKYELLLIIAAILWGLTFPGTKYIGADIDSMGLLAIRCTLSALTMILMYAGKLKEIKWKMIIPSAAVVMLSVVGTYFQVEGIKNTSSGNAGFIAATNIIFVPLFAFLIYKKKPQKAFYPGLLAIMAGFLFVSGIISLNPFSVNFTSIKYGDLLVLIYAIMVGLYFLFFNKLAEKYDETLINTLMAISGAIGAWVLWILLPGKMMDFSDSGTVFWVVLCGVGGTGIANLLVAKAQANLDASKVSVLCSLQSVFAMVFAATIPGRDGMIEPITLTAAIGGALILTGIVIISKKNKN